MLKKKFQPMPFVFRSIEKLQRWLNGEPLEHLSTPLFIPSSTLLSMPLTIKQLSSDETGVSPLSQVN